MQACCIGEGERERGRAHGIREERRGEGRGGEERRKKTSPDAHRRDRDARAVVVDAGEDERNPAAVLPTAAQDLLKGGKVHHCSDVHHLGDDLDVGVDVCRDGSKWRGVGCRVS